MIYSTSSKPFWIVSYVYFFADLKTDQTCHISCSYDPCATFQVFWSFMWETHWNVTFAQYWLFHKLTQTQTLLLLTVVMLIFLIEQKILFKTSLNEEHIKTHSVIIVVSQQLLQGAFSCDTFDVTFCNVVVNSQTYPIRQGMKAVEDKLLKCNVNSCFSTVDTSKGFNRCSLFAIKYWLKLP